MNVFLVLFSQKYNFSNSNQTLLIAIEKSFLNMSNNVDLYIRIVTVNDNITMYFHDVRFVYIYTVTFHWNRCFARQYCIQMCETLKKLKSFKRQLTTPRFYYQFTYLLDLFTIAKTYRFLFASHFVFPP